MRNLLRWRQICGRGAGCGPGRCGMAGMGCLKPINFHLSAARQADAAAPSGHVLIPELGKSFTFFSK